MVNSSYNYKCTKCGKPKQAHEMGADVTRKNGRHPWCRSCKNRAMREFRSTHPLTAEQRKKDIARSYAHVYLKRGKLIRPEKCPICGEKSKLQMHHSDYDRPLMIEWLCEPCHRAFR